MANVSHLIEDLRILCGYWHLLEFGAPAGVRVPHTDRVHLYIILDGQVSITCGHADPISLRAGDCVLLARGKPHILNDRQGSPAVRLRLLEETNSDADIVRAVRIGAPGQAARVLAGVCAFVGPHFQSLRTALPEIAVLRQADPAEAGYCRPCGDLAGLASRSGANALLNRWAEFLVMDQISAAVGGNAIEGMIEATAMGQPQIGAALRVMAVRYSEEWCVSKLAAAVGMSRTAFFKRFQAVTGKAPAQHLTDLRMAAALDLLRDGESKLVDVAKRVGYDSDVSFSRAFKRVHGASPSSFRQSRLTKRVG